MRQPVLHVAVLFFEIKGKTLDMTENVTTSGAPSPAQLDAWQRLWEVLLAPDDEASDAEDQEA
jgi:hypothetical protein